MERERLIQKHFRFPVTEMDCQNSTFHKLDEPYRNLWLAVIQQAFQDILLGEECFRVYALNWLNSKDAQNIFDYLNIEGLCKTRVSILKKCKKGSAFCATT